MQFLHYLNTWNEHSFLSTSSSLLESYDSSEHFVGFFIILKNASGVVLRKGKWFKFDAAAFNLLIFLFYIPSQDTFSSLLVTMQVSFLSRLLKLDLRETIFDEFWWHTAISHLLPPSDVVLISRRISGQQCASNWIWELSRAVRQY